MERDANKTRAAIDTNTKEFKKLNDQLRNMKDNRDRLAAQETRTDEEQKQYERLCKRIEEYNQKIENNKENGRKLSETFRKQAIAVQEAHKRMEDYHEEIGFGKLSLNDLNQKQKELNTLLRNLKPGTDDFIRYSAELREVNAQIERTKAEIYETKESLEKTGGAWKSYLKIINEFGFAIKQFAELLKTDANQAILQFHSGGFAIRPR